MNLEHKASRNKLIQEVVVLVVIIVLIGVVTMLHAGTFGKSASSNTPVTQPLDTTFDTNALNAVKQKDTTNPNIDPVSGELGKNDPFAP